MLSLLLEPSTTVARPQGGGGFVWFGLIAFATIALIVVARWRGGRAGASQTSWRTRTGAAVGNALHDLDGALMPNHPDAAVIRRIDEEGEHDECGDGRNPERLRRDTQRRETSPHR